MRMHFDPALERCEELDGMRCYLRDSRAREGDPATALAQRPGTLSWEGYAGSIKVERVEVLPAP